MTAVNFQDVEKDHWDRNWSGVISQKPLSRLNIVNRDIDHLFREELAGYRSLDVIEIGGAPGKMLLHMERNFAARRCLALDYSEVGCRSAEAYLKANNSSATIMCCDVLKGTPPGLEADLVYSMGVVEHFADPTAMVEAHLRMVRPGGKAIITLPNFSGLNARLQRWLDPENLAIHNLATMDPAYWSQRMDKWPEFRLRAFRAGRPSPWMFSLLKYGRLGRFVSYAVNFAAYAVPRSARVLPSLVVAIYERRR
jgi:2-polyprenyl-3-methyl-5-hydroxy-6-metoxy-1,4-benzoquinol methylase